MTASSLPAALRAGAEGLYALEAVAGLIIAQASWLAREDFTRFIHVGTSISGPATELASIDWEAAIRALDAGELPGSAGGQPVDRGRTTFREGNLRRSGRVADSVTLGFHARQVSCRLH